MAERDQVSRAFSAHDTGNARGSQHVAFLGFTRFNERERIRLEKEAEAERLRQQEADRQRKLEEQRRAEEAARQAAEAAARAEQERIAKEQAAAREQAKQARRTEIKTGIEAQPLAPPPAVNDLFQNIEKLFKPKPQ